MIVSANGTRIFNKHLNIMPHINLLMKILFFFHSLARSLIKRKCVVDEKLSRDAFLHALSLSLCLSQSVIIWVKNLLEKMSVCVIVWENSLLSVPLLTQLSNLARTTTKRKMFKLQNVLAHDRGFFIIKTAINRESECLHYKSKRVYNFPMCVSSSAA
jgi:hypothetical protein